MDLFTRSLWGLPLQSGGRKRQRCQSPAAVPGRGTAGGPRAVPGGTPAKVRSGGSRDPPASPSSSGFFSPIRFP